MLSLPDDIKTTEIEGYNGYVNDDPSFVSKYKYFVAEGLSLYTWYLPKYAGVDSETGEALFYKDVTDEATGAVTRETTKNASDATEYLCGDALPKFQGGLSTSFRYKNFDFSVQTTFQLGGKGYDYVYQVLMHSGGQTGTTWHKDMLNGTLGRKPIIPIFLLSAIPTPMASLLARTGSSPARVISASRM